MGRKRFKTVIYIFITGSTLLKLNYYKYFQVLSECKDDITVLKGANLTFLAPALCISV